jgi:hypothetical protein
MAGVLQILLPLGLEPIDLQQFLELARLLEFFELLKHF